LPAVRTVEERDAFSVAVSEGETEKQIEAWQAEEAAVAEGRANFNANGGFNRLNRPATRGYRGELAAAATTSTATADDQAKGMSPPRTRRQLSDEGAAVHRAVVNIAPPPSGRGFFDDHGKGGSIDSGRRNSAGGRSLAQLDADLNGISPTDTRHVLERTSQDDRGKGGFRDDRGKGGFRDDRGKGGFRDDRGKGGFRDDRGKGGFGS
jgi:hypothetical protein